MWTCFFDGEVARELLASGQQLHSSAAYDNNTGSLCVVQLEAEDKLVISCFVYSMKETSVT
jgi:hypothetical protein